MARRTRMGAREMIIGVVIVAVVAGIVVALVSTGSDSGSAAGQPQVSTAQRGDLAVTVDAPFTLALASTTPLTAPSASAGGTAGAASSGPSSAASSSSSATSVITSMALSVGAPIPSLMPLYSISGAPVFGVPSAVPFYRTLVSGNTGFDVVALQAALADAGYTVPVTGTYGSATVNAVDQFQAGHGLTQTGTATPAQFESFPPGAVVLDIPLGTGQRAATGATIADVGVLSALVAQAQVGQADVTRLQAGQAAALDFDALSNARATGVVANVPPQATASGSTASGSGGAGSSGAAGGGSAGSSSPVQYLVSITPAQLPTGARVGMTGQAHNTIEGRNGVVIVPASAIGGSTDAPTVQVRRNGATVVRPVIVGLVTASEAEIISGIQPGDVVVTGTLAPAASVPSTTPGIGGGGSGRGFGGGSGGNAGGRGFGGGG